MIRALLTLLLALFACVAVAAFSAGYFYTWGELRATQIDVAPCPAQPQTWRRA